MKGASDVAEADHEALTAESAPQVLGHYLFEAFVRALRNLPEEERLAQQVQLANRLVAFLGDVAPKSGIDDDDAITESGRLLLAVRSIADARLGTGELTYAVRRTLGAPQSTGSPSTPPRRVRYVVAST